MFGRTHALRCLSLLMLTALFGLILSELSDAAEKKDYTPPTQSKPLAAKTAGTKLDQAAISRLIDQQLNERLAAEKIVPSGRADDAEFLRRAYLDISGHIPSAEKAAAFLDSKDANKRAKLIDELLASPDYGRHMADIWQNLLIVHNSDNRRLNPEPMVEWLKTEFNENKPWDKMVHAIITASGEVDTNPAGLYFISQGTVDKMTDNVTKVFLGVQLQCAQCHNHPFTDYKQTEYWGMAAFFLKVQTGNANKAAKNGTKLAVTETARPKRGKKGLPPSAKILPPKFLRGDLAKISNGPLRPALADWMTTAKNPFFSKAMANRLWAQKPFMGRGIVNPVDDIRDGNDPSHPQLLAELAEQFAANGFDVKFLIRAICNSDAYQRTSRPTSANKDAPAAVYSRMAVKMMTGEQLVDSLEEVVGPPAANRGGRANKPKAAKGQYRNPRANLVAFFGGDETLDVTEYQDGIPQVLRLMNSPALSRSPKLLAITRSAKTPEQALEQIFLTTLSRRPKPEEMNKLTAYVQKVGPREAYGDILWAVLNSSEFRVNR